MSRGSCGRLGGRGCQVRVEEHITRGRPIADAAGPALGVGAPGALIEVPAAGEDVVLSAEVALVGGDEPDRAVAVLAVVPGDETSDPASSVGAVRERAG